MLSYGQCDTFARLGRSSKIHFLNPQGLSCCTTKSCVAICLCDTFARLGRSPCFHFKPLGLSRCTAKSCVALCWFYVLCSSSIPYVPLPFSCLPSCSRTFHDMHSHRTLFHLKLYLHSPAACHSQHRLRTTTICQPVAVLTPPHASYHFHASFPFTCFHVYCSRVVLGHFLCL
jgi:hypothetical protein